MNPLNAPCFGNPPLQAWYGKWGRMSTKERIVKLTVGFGTNYIVYIDENGDERDEECFVSFSNVTDMYVEIKEMGFRHIHVHIPLQKLY